MTSGVKRGSFQNAFGHKAERREKGGVAHDLIRE